VRRFVNAAIVAAATVFLVERLSVLRWLGGDFRVRDFGGGRGSLSFAGCE
jgi:hypothetical protein